MYIMAVSVISVNVTYYTKNIDEVWLEFRSILGIRKM